MQELHEYGFSDVPYTGDFYDEEANPIIACCGEPSCRRAVRETHAVYVVHKDAPWTRFCSPACLAKKMLSSRNAPYIPPRRAD